MNSAGLSSGRILFRASLAVLVAYLLGMAVLWILGVESIYAHPTPFYALYQPVFSTPVVPLAALWTAALATLVAVRRAGLRPARLGAAPLTAFAAGFAAIAALAALRAQAAPQGALPWLADAAREFAWHLGPVSVFFGFAAALSRSALPSALAGLGPEPDTAETRRILAGAAVFLFFFACTVAALRHGLQGISQTYQRDAYEYVGDIGKTGTIRDLFARYMAIREYLSMHAKVHPPGPIALLWVMSWVVTRDPLALSLATAAFGALGVFPLHGWLRAAFGPRAALAGVLTYTAVPSIVLFTATSADILFTPFTLTALWAFERSLRGGRAGWALLGGAAYALATLLSFSLVGVGVYFAAAGLFAFARPESRGAVVRTAAIMLAAFIGVHGLVWLWSGFDYVAALRAAKAQFDLDQYNLDRFTPRYPGWTFRLIFNPAAWFYFAGIPVSLLFLRQLLAAVPFRGERETTDVGGGPALGPRATVAAFALAAVALNFLYLARGEGERSALYLMPFLVGPAALWLAGVCERARSAEPLWAMLGFLAFQCWVTELYFYTYW